MRFVSGLFRFGLIRLCSPRQDIIRSVAGPISQSLAAVEKYMEALPAAKPWEIDPHVIPIPWRSELCTTTKRLRIGYLVDDGVIKVQPPVARAVREVVDSLKAAGHEGKFSICLFKAPC